ncbi:MAG TPA: 3',5'-cyclic-AMP phosphodiesterase [Pseudomonas xinjiangensis]|uniref:3',5'-cyclic-AMP phosphodiesterase n=2 Tax=root TaxID=1 RepID=A0A7V1FSH3_9GAMM|nr:3',5'-cyclic-AMP phosphodiesterase [Halopseudomonas xinjiangensis]HEC49483.1 3',5'-cyclic-AMP phosphodiesterase [Halopseudomonas xinjiangensis]
MPPTATTINYVSLIQLTDSHLFADPADRLLGMDTFASLNAVVDQIIAERPAMDLVLATGDITQDGSEAAYRRFMKALERLSSRYLWIPGNHDDAGLMADLGSESGLTEPWVDIGNWRIVMLDSSIPGAVPGFLRDEQLRLLDEALDTAQTRHVMICLHHHPVDVNVGWMEPLGLRNAPQFLQRLEGCKQVRCVLWGHIHQQVDQMREGVRMLAAPSTCIQFAPHTEDFATDEQQPGYRWLRLFDDGRLETGISRLAAGRFTPDPGATGY